MWTNLNFIRISLLKLLIRTSFSLFFQLLSCFTALFSIRNKWLLPASSRLITDYFTGHKFVKSKYLTLDNNLFFFKSDYWTHLTTLCSTDFWFYHLLLTLYTRILLVILFAASTALKFISIINLEKKHKQKRSIVQLAALFLPNKMEST